MIEEIRIMGRIKEDEDEEKMVEDFRNQIRNSSLGDCLDNSPFMEINYDIDDSDGETSEVSIVYGREE